jgi:hypothetical protein
MGHGGQREIVHIAAAALVGEGQCNDFPREIIIPPSTGVNVSVQSVTRAFTPGESTPWPTLTVHVVFHVLVPRD